jgi:hypothetical protein
MSISELEFRFQYQDFDSGIGIPISVPDLDINVEISKRFSPKLVKIYILIAFLNLDSVCLNWNRNSDLFR